MDGFIKHHTLCDITLFECLVQFSKIDDEHYYDMKKRSHAVKKILYFNTRE